MIIDVNKEIKMCTLKIKLFSHKHLHNYISNYACTVCRLKENLFQTVLHNLKPSMLLTSSQTKSSITIINQQNHPMFIFELIYIYVTKSYFSLP